MDAILDIDWAEHWRLLAKARQSASPGADHWAGRAGRFARSIRHQPDYFLTFLEPWLNSHKTALDVGAGVGRHSLPLARRLDWVTAVEPSEAMRELMPGADNLTVIASEWLDAEPAPADLVICVHVLQLVPDAAPFLEKLSASAKERVFVVMRDAPFGHPAQQMPGAVRAREPWLRDCLLLLRQLGLEPELAMFRYPVSFHYASVQEALRDCGQEDFDLERSKEVRSWLESRLQRGPDGDLVFAGGDTVAGVLHWAPQRDPN
ncbi:MAG: class I SAM-dependent methyltransferase [Candidatus Dormibacter sp.]|uniref:class I SAM-dependent methyltransferase n=1 Tax=Candidatus Dormibacter sp. TaxID=2973982 RepID=UPI000DAFE262|nr:MAG: hypothetical protein DLM66_05205 [Candidatus Dormibacteraeota bacterium]